MKAAVTLLALSLILAQAAAAANYNITKVSENTLGDDLYPAFNNRGQIAYYHTAVQFQTGDPSVTYEETGKYLFYQGGQYTTLNVPPNVASPYNYAHAPALLLNNLGQMSFQIQDYDGDGKMKVYFVAGPGGSPQLLNSSAHQKYYLQLNQNGKAVFLSANSNAQVLLFDGANVTQITNYNYDAGPGLCVWGLSMNDLDQVVWVEGDSATSNIMLYDGGSVGQIPGGSGFSSGSVCYLQINARGRVVWLGRKNSEVVNNIYLFRDGVTSPVTGYGAVTEIDISQNDHGGGGMTRFSPYLNNMDEIVWVTRTPNSSVSRYLDMALYVYGRGQITRLDNWTVDPTMVTNSNVVAEHAVFATINDAGQVVWSRYTGLLVPDRGSHFEVFLANPVRDNAIFELLLLSD